MTITVPFLPEINQEINATFADIVAQRDSLAVELSKMTAERDTLKQQLDFYLADRDKSPWKSVDEPPKKSGVYLVIEDDVYYIAEYDACGKEWHSEERYTYLIPTHWTEIPDLCL